MRIFRILFVSAAILITVVLSACGGGRASGLVVIPPDIEKAAAPVDKYQDVHAIYLYDIGFIHYDPMEVGHSSYPNYVFSEFVKVKLLTRKATESDMWGNIFIRHYKELRELDAHVIKKDGTQVKLKKDDYITNIILKDIVPGAIPPIHVYETVIVFPGLEPGDTIVYYYTKNDQDMFWTFSKIDAPVLYSKFMVARPQARVLVQPLIYDRHNLKPEYSEDTGMATGMAGRTGSRRAEFDIWTVDNVPAVKSEAAMPPLADIASRVRVWQGDRKFDWNVLGTSYSKWFNHYRRPTGLVKELADKVVKGISDDREKARAIHDWVKETLNIVDYGRLSYAPREFEITVIQFDDLMKEKNASPEQAANLMYHMMKAAGLNVTLVLTTNQFQPAFEEGLPDLYQFTYPLLALGDGTLIDTTSRYVPFGQIPFWFEGRKSMWILGETVSFKNLPVTKAVDNKSTLAVQAEVDSEGNAKVEVKRTLTGQRALELRRRLIPINDQQRERAIRNWVTWAAKKAELGKFAINNLKDPAKPLEMVVNYTVPNYAEVLRDKQVMKLGAFVHLTSCPELVSAQRKLPIWFPFSNLEEMDIQIKLPQGFTLQALPKGFRTRQIEEDTAVGVQTSYGSPDGKSLHVIRKFSINQTSVTVDGYKNLQNMIRRYLAQKDTLITMELPKLTD